MLFYQSLENTPANTYELKIFSLVDNIFQGYFVFLLMLNCHLKSWQYCNMTYFTVETKSSSTPPESSNCSSVLASPVDCKPMTTHYKRQAQEWINDYQFRCRNRWKHMESINLSSFFPTPWKLSPCLLIIGPFLILIFPFLTASLAILTQCGTFADIHRYLK